MKIGNILNNLRDSAIEEYELAYEEKYENFFEMFMAPNDLKQLSIEQILVILDNRPHSLISISYALRFATAFNADLVVAANLGHVTLIKNKAESMNIPVRVFEFDNIDFPQINEIVKSNRIDLVIMSYTHEIRERLQNTLHLPILVTKASQFTNA